MAESWRLSPYRFVAYPAPEQDHGFDETQHNPASRLQKYRLTAKGRRLATFHMPAKRKAAKTDSTATIGFEAKLWLAAEQAVPASHISQAEHNVGRPQGLLGLIFLKSEGG